MSPTLALAREIAMTHLNRPYRWGGNDPMEGFDCSGLMIEILKSVGVLPITGDWTAAQLMGMFPVVYTPRLGVLVGWGDPANHIEFCLDTDLSLGASGGGRLTVDDEAAMRHDAYTKIRPFGPRGGRRFVDPFHALR